MFIEPNAPVLAQYCELVDAGKVRPVIGGEFALKDVAKAHALSRSGRAASKIAYTLNNLI